MTDRMKELEKSVKELEREVKRLKNAIKELKRRGEENISDRHLAYIFATLFNAVGRTENFLLNSFRSG